jgi:hypothetical protein
LDAKAVFAAISALLAVVGALGIAYAVFKSATVTKTIDLLETENKALGQSVSRQAGDITTLQERVTTLESENKVLRNVVTGKSVIDELAEKVVQEEKDRHDEHESMTFLLNSIMTLLKDILGTMRGSRGEIGR